VRLFLDFGCSVNQCDTQGQMTPLHLAASRGNVQLLNILLRNKASVKSLDEQKRTALHWAAQQCHSDSVEMVELLLAHRSEIDALDQEKSSPLLLACKNLSRQSAVASLLLSHGADASLADQLGNTVLHLAVSATSVDAHLVRSLVSSGAKVNATNQAGLTPLHVALQQQQQQESRTEIIKMFVEAGYELDQPTPLGSLVHIVMIHLFICFFVGFFHIVRVCEGTLPWWCLVAAWMNNQ